MACPSTARHIVMLILLSGVSTILAGEPYHCSYTSSLG